VTPDGDFRLFLQNELVRRCKTNPRYSLRAFSRALGVEPSAMSKLLSGKRAISRPMFERLAKRLALEPAEVRHFQGATAQPMKRGETFSQISADAFQVIADWYHFALLELMTVDNFRHDPAWIARALGLTVSEVRFAIERLERLGLLAVAADGSLTRMERDLTTIGADFTTAALRKMQRQILEMAARALDEVPIERRDQSAMTMAINADKLPEAKERIKAFRRKLCAFLEADPPKHDVYQLSIALYPVSDTAQAAKGVRK
jgi:uncharacterized protein (TIGR02147 family)